MSIPGAAAVPYLRLVSWNMGGAFAGSRTEWDYLLSDPTLDAGILQETPYPTGVEVETVPDRGTYWKTETGGQFRSRTAIARLSDRVALAEVPTAPLGYAGSGEMAVSRMGTVTAAEVVVAATEERITVISVYGLWENPVPYQQLMYSDASMHRILSDISVLVSGSDRRVVLAGDFNVVRHLDDPAEAPVWAKRSQSVFDRLDALGFCFVACDGDGPTTQTPGLPGDSDAVVTFRSKKADPATGRFQLDYVYVTPNLFDRTTATALNVGDQWGPSDHCQIGIDIAQPTEAIWNETTVTRTVALQIGSEAGRTVERLFTWAHAQDIRLEFSKAEDGRSGQVLFQCDRGPDGYQFTYLLDVKGTVKLKLRWMREPFRHAPTREPIRLRLNEIRGVDIPADKLNGEPDLPLSVLADPGSLEQFLAAFDYVLDRTRRAEATPEV